MMMDGKVHSTYSNDLPCEYIEAFVIDTFRFYGSYVFKKNGANMLLGKNGCMILLDDYLLETLVNQVPSDDLQFKLVQHGLAHVPGKVMFHCEKDVEIRYFIIDITKKCNFDCIYCFRDLQNTRTISFEVLDDILQYILEYCNKEGIRQIGLQMWGGEPILALDRIEYVISFFSKTTLKVSIDVETNASLVTRDIASKLFHWDIHVGVSLDGTPEFQNKQRRMIGATKLSSEYTEQGIRNLKEFYKDDIGGIVVVTKYNFKHIKEILDYFIYTLHLTSMKFNFVRDNKNAKEDNLGLNEEDISWFANELLDYLQAYRVLGANFSEGNIEIRIKNLLQRSRISCCISEGCQGGRKIISFDQDGNIFPCEMTDFPDEKLGSIYDLTDLTQQIKESVKNHLFFAEKKDERCVKCPWWCYCRGGCSSRNRYMGNDGRIDETECCLNHTIYPRLTEWILDGYFS